MTASLARKLLVFIGGWLAARGYATAENADGAVQMILDNADLISGAACTLAGIGWSVYQRLTAK